MIAYMITYNRGESYMNRDQMNYIDKYNKENYKMYPFRVRKNNYSVIEKLNNIANKNKYILDLIERDINPSVLTIKQIKDRIKPVMEKHKIKDVYLFGSYARGEANSDSDIDIYCEKGDVDTLFKSVDFDEELEKALGKKVDVITIGSNMHDYFKKQLEEDMIKIC